MRILIADDHEVVRHGIRSILQTRPHWQICGEARDGKLAVRLARELLPDVVIMDIVMPTMNGLEATERLIQEGCTSRVLILALEASETLRETARRAGARGYVAKSRAARSLIDALERVHAGGTFFDGEQADQQADEQGETSGDAGQPLPD
jgi:DNA-binding NarL/FixJ family response regulator